MPDAPLPFVPDATSHPVFERLRELSGARPLVASHRGDSRHHPENTLVSLRAAGDLGVAVQEFDVRQLGSGELLCVHDASFDRTSDASALLGPGALVKDLDVTTARRLDAGRWFHERFAGERVPTLEQALAVIHPAAVALVEHKAGDPERYVRTLRDAGLAEHVILQSFDHRFLQRIRRLAPEIALGALGPIPPFRDLDEATLAHLDELGVGLVHWRANDLDPAAVRRCHDRGHLVCSYTTDDALGWLGGRALGIDIMCTNDPGAMRRCLDDATGCG